MKPFNVVIFLSLFSTVNESTPRGAPQNHFLWDRSAQLYMAKFFNSVTWQMEQVYALRLHIRKYPFWSRSSHFKLKIVAKTSISD